MGGVVIGVSFVSSFGVIVVGTGRVVNKGIIGFLVKGV